MHRTKLVAEELEDSLYKKCQQLEEAYQAGVTRLNEAQKEMTTLKTQLDETKKNNIKLTTSIAASRKSEEASRSKLQEAEKKVIMAKAK